jgi:hypothetical protein
MRHDAKPLEFMGRTVPKGCFESSQDAERPKTIQISASIGR